jgi:hypothetical protein
MYLTYNGFATEETFSLCSGDNMKIPEWNGYKFNGCVVKDCNISFDGIKYCDTKYFTIIDGVFIN